MYLVAQGVEELYDEDLAMPWYRLASANGNQEAEEFVENHENNDWDEDEEDYDDEDSDDESSSSTGSGFCTSCGTGRSGAAKFCTNCGTGRSGAAKFCTNCGTAFEQPKIVATKKTDKPKNF